MKALSFVMKYLFIGLLVGIGICSVDFVYQKFYFEDKQVERIDNLRIAVEELVELIYQPGHKSIWQRLEEEKPEALLTFNLERYKLLEKSVQVSGRVENVGLGIFEGVLVDSNIDFRAHGSSDFTFHVYFLGHDAVTKHRFRFERTLNGDLFKIIWFGKITLAYIGDYELKYDFLADISRVAFPKIGPA